ncbi:hypothetical protein CKM354_000304600 [Cercospora kikuchii]|uniref:RRM domain-containing protein n=1 Tax=Cercospora kikuchii TaxID=84275 RepID=A0A9P3CBF1_9PEZI|nr:uncharacterized protein CKM354_000304600 [Cercospora kikuchii]GIZ39671.1 hypothetical protein CKM354_000304600 [Cercospora kikuchii]
MAPRAPFPDNPDSFAGDTRISWSKEKGSYILEDENEVEWEWLAHVNKWSETIDEDAMRRQAEIYMVPGVDENAPGVDPVKKRKAAQDQSDSNKKAKAGPAVGDASTNAIANASASAGANANAASSAAVNDNADATATAAPAAAPSKPTTAIFVSGLPLDTDEGEVRDCFCKFGIIQESVDGNKQRIKLYRDEHGDLTGEALVIFLKPESVRIAIDMQDGFEFPRDFGLPTGPITVQVADHSYKKTNDDTAAPSKSSSKKSKPSKAQTKKKAEEMNSRLNDWSDDDLGTVQQPARRSDKIAVLKGVFLRKELEEDPELLSELMEDMQEDAVNYGVVKNITIFDLEEDGIVTIRFASVDAARACVAKNNGRIFDGRRLVASIATGDEKFQKSRKADKDKDAEEAKRLEDYSKYIEGEDGGEKGGRDS